MTKYGGQRLYSRLKPLMIGLIAGEILAGVIFIVIGTFYYYVTHEPPVWYRILKL